MEAIDLAPPRDVVGQECQDDVERVEDDAPGFHLRGLRLERGQHPAQVEDPRLHHVGHRLGVEEEELLLAQLREVPSEAFRVVHDALRSLLEGDEHTRLVAFLRAMDEELQREDRLARAGPAHEQRGAPVRQAAAGDVVEARDAGRSLRG